MSDMHKCPRCEAAAIIGNSGALSRLTRDGGAEIIICDRCGQREALYGRDTEDHVQISDWPVTIGTLLDEEEGLIRQAREGELRWLSTEHLDGDAA